MAELRVIENNIHVPGLLRCDKCSFELTRSVMNACTGNLTAGTSEPEPCPNGCGQLRPVTWHEHALEAWHRASEFLDRSIGAEKARDDLRALWLEWLEGLYDGADLLRRVRLAVHGPLRKPDSTVGVQASDPAYCPICGPKELGHRKDCPYGVTVVDASTPDGGERP